MGDNHNDDWASAEFGDANLGDARLVRRLVALARRLGCAPQCPFPQSLTLAELKAAYRFSDNAQVDTNGILAPHIAQTLDRMRQVPVVLAVQDTTEFNLAHLSATEGLGYCTGSNTRGFMMHSLLAVTPDGLPLGVLGMKTWVRPEAEFGKTRQRKSHSVHEKESVKWLEGVEHLASLKTRCADTRFVGVGDRESDLCMREMFAWACETWSRISSVASNFSEREVLLEQHAEHGLPSDDRVDHEEYLDILAETARARNGWQRILTRCTPARRRKGAARCQDE